MSCFQCENGGDFLCEQGCDERYCYPCLHNHKMCHGCQMEGRHGFCKQLDTKECSGCNKLYCGGDFFFHKRQCYMLDICYTCHVFTPKKPPYRTCSENNCDKMSCEHCIDLSGIIPIKFPTGSCMLHLESVLSEEMCTNCKCRYPKQYQVFFLGNIDYKYCCFCADELMMVYWCLKQKDVSKDIIWYIIRKYM